MIYTKSTIKKRNDAALSACFTSKELRDILILIFINQTFFEIRIILCAKNIRPYIFGTKDNPDLKEGLIYENQYQNVPQFFRGETGAQSSIIPFLDGALGIYHTNDNLRPYLNEMRLRRK